MKKIFLFLSLTLYSAYCMDLRYEAVTSRTTYKGTEITPQTILSLMPGRPEGTRRAIKKWMKHHETVVDTIESIKVSPSDPSEDIAPIYVGGMASKKPLVDRDVVDQGSWKNYVFKMGTLHWFAKISSGVARAVNLFISAGGSAKAYSDGIHLHKESFGIGELTDYTTYQTIAKAACTLKAQEALEKFSCRYIATLPTYLIRLPGHPKIVCDENYMIIQEALPSHVPNKSIEDAQTKLSQMPDDIVEELFHVIVWGGLEDILFYKNWTVVGNKITLFDLELCPFYDREKFFNKDQKRFRDETLCTIHTLIDLIEKDRKKSGILKDLIRTHFAADEVSHLLNCFGIKK